MVFEPINENKRRSKKMFKRYCKKCGELKDVTSKFSKVCSDCRTEPYTIRKRREDLKKNMRIYFHSLTMIKTYTSENINKELKFSYKEQLKGFKAIKFHVDRINEMIKELRDVEK